MDASHTLAALVGAGLGAAVTYFIVWYHARKVEALVPGGLKAWDTYDTHTDNASPTGRTVTTS